MQAIIRVINNANMRKERIDVFRVKSMIDTAVLFKNELCKKDPSMSGLEGELKEKQYLNRNDARVLN